MRELNIDFEEKYKEADNFIKNAYSVEQGITAYINAMQEIDPARRKNISSWDNDLKQLKHLRWIRNQLAHSVSIDSDLCQAEDYSWMYSFCNRLYDEKDPLAQLINAEKAARKPAYSEYRKNKYGTDKRKKKSDGVAAFIAAVIVTAAITGMVILILELIY